MLLHLSRTVLPILTLAQTLYLSTNLTYLQHGEEGVVGEELLHWLNQHDLAITTEQGREIADVAEPYLHPSYWDYILRCTLRGFHATTSSLLASLLTLPSEAIKTLVGRITALVDHIPRSVHFKTELQFKSARREFHLKLVGVLAELEAVMDEVQDEFTASYAAESDAEGRDPEEEAEDLRLSLEAGLRVFLEVLVGNRERVVEAAEDWREALCAWGTLVDIGLKRAGIADALEKIEQLRGASILSEASDDSAGTTEKVMVHLLKGSPQEACELVFSLDPYLAQVFIDATTKLALVPSTSAAPDTPSLTEKANLIYANTLLATFGFWRMALDYLSHANVRGRARMSQIVLGLPLLEDPSAKDKKTSTSTGMDEGDEDEESAPEPEKGEFYLTESVLDACATFGMTREAKAICRKMSLYLSTASADPATSSTAASASSSTPVLAQPRFGPAIVFSMRSPPRGDATALKLIKRRILDGLLTRKASASTQKRSSADAWLVEQVDDIKRWIIRASRAEAERAMDEVTPQHGDGAQGGSAAPFLHLQPGASKQMLASISLEEEEMLLADEEEWLHRFTATLPAPVLFLVQFARFFRLKAQTSDPAAQTQAAASLVELLNSGLVDGDWTAICLYEVGLALHTSASITGSGSLPGAGSGVGAGSAPAFASPLSFLSSSAPTLPATTLHDVLRLLETVLTAAQLSPEEADFHLLKLGRWLGAAGAAYLAAAAEDNTDTDGNAASAGLTGRKHLTKSGKAGAGAGAEGAVEESVRRAEVLSCAQKEMRTLRLTLALALSRACVANTQVPGLVPQLGVGVGAGVGGPAWEVKDGWIGESVGPGQDVSMEMGV